MGGDGTAERALAHIKKQLEGDASGHDYWHIVRVRNNAIAIAKGETGADMRTVELAAILHDIADWKFNEGDAKAGGRAARKWLESDGVDAATTERVCHAIDEVSFKGAGVNTTPTTIEGKIVQDADRLDAIGAIGIARAFAYGGSQGREIHNPDRKPERHESFEAYKAAKGSTINHFHEKLLLLKDRMNTGSARRMADERDAFMREFLSRFMDEWEGKK